jgi:hypothetical protein
MAEDKSSTELAIVALWDVVERVAANKDIEFVSKSDGFFVLELLHLLLYELIQLMDRFSNRIIHLTKPFFEIEFSNLALMF